MARAKSMSRSRNQIASSYAPESFFTFEGGSGACIARATAGEAIFLAEPTLNQIFERINELGRAWFSAAMSARDNDLTKRRLAALTDAAGDEAKNLMPFIIDAARAYATEGEIRNAMREVFGDHVETPEF